MRSTCGWRRCGDEIVHRLVERFAALRQRQVRAQEVVLFSVRRVEIVDRRVEVFDGGGAAIIIVLRDDNRACAESPRERTR